MEPPRPGGSRKNAVAAAVVLAGVAVLATIPALCNRLERPTEQYASVAEARAAGAFGQGRLPAGIVPPSAIEIHEKREVDTDRVWLRYAADPREVEALAAPLRRLPVEEVERLQVPSPGYAKWWLVSSRTLSGSQGKVLRVYEAPGGYLAVDPRSSIVYYWSR